MPERLDTLSLISIQHELAMNIGLNPELKPMARRFMEVCLRRLSLRRVYLFLRFEADDVLPGEARKGPGDTWSLAMPTGGNDAHEPDEKINAQVQILLQEEAARAETVLLQPELLYLHLFKLPRMGVLVMERLHIPLQPDLINALIPIVERLSTGCQAAIQHERIILEIARRKEAEKHIEHLAYYDDMTGLPNRRKLLIQIAEMKQLLGKNGWHSGMLYIDLDNFRDINDSMGYIYGDAFLAELSNRFRRPQFKDFFSARLAGDAFVLLTPPIPGAQEFHQRIIQIARSIQTMIAEPLNLGERTLSVSASIGIVELMDDNDDADLLLAHGSQAMYQAKSLGRNMLHFYDASMAEAAERRFILDSEMRTALGENQFDLYLQPQVDEMGDVTGAEALIRWMHPSKGLVTPAAFIFQAERSGFIVPLSEWVLRHACGYIRKLQNGNLLPAGGHIAVNLSAKFFHQADFVYRTLSIVDEYGIDPGNIELELTEGTLLDNVDDAINKIYALKERGIRFSIDDFGTGYSSLAYVKRLPIDRLKIDRSFVHNIDSSPDDAAIVETILSIARHFNLEIIAEGVETAVEREFLQNLGCLAFQGYLFHRPMPFTEFQQLQLTGKRKQSA